MYVCGVQLDKVLVEAGTERLMNISSPDEIHIYIHAYTLCVLCVLRVGGFTHTYIHEWIHTYNAILCVSLVAVMLWGLLFLTSTAWVYGYMDVSLCICMSTINVYVCGKCLCIHTMYVSCVCTCTHSRHIMYTCAWLQVWKTYICVYTCMYICICMCMCICTFTYMMHVQCLCICIHMYGKCKCTHVHVYTNMYTNTIIIE